MKYVVKNKDGSKLNQAIALLQSTTKLRLKLIPMHSMFESLGKASCIEQLIIYLIRKVLNSLCLSSPNLYI